MGRHKIKNPKDKFIFVRLDKKLYEQLIEYANRNDNSVVAVSARRAIEQFIKEAELHA